MYRTKYADSFSTGLHRYFTTLHIIFDHTDRNPNPEGYDDTFRCDMRGDSALCHLIHLP